MGRGSPDVCDDFGAGLERGLELFKTKKAVRGDFGADGNEQWHMIRGKMAERG